MNKTVVMVIGGYLLLVCGAAWYSNANATATPTADSLASLPGASLGTTGALIGAAMLMFAGKIAAKI